MYKESGPAAYSKQNPLDVIVGTLECSALIKAIPNHSKNDGYTNIFDI